MEVSVWWVRYADEHGDERAEPASRDYDSAAAILAEKVRRVEQIKAGLVSPSADQAKVLLSVRAEQYRDHLRSLRRGAKHFELTYSRIVKVLEGLRWRVFGDINPDELVTWLERLRVTPQGKGGVAKKGVSVETSNHYLRATKAFSAWLSGQVKAYDPLASLKTLNSEVDRRLIRRALSREDFEKLLAATAKSRRSFRGLGPADRWALYLTASLTGLRVSELASLTPESLDFDAGSLEIQAAYAKDRKSALLPLARDLVGQLAGWVSGRETATPLWPGTWTEKAAAMLRGDLEAAAIPFADSRGRVFDFHALRGQFITDLARAGVGQSVAQKLARHSSPHLTARYYTHLDTVDLAREVDKLEVAKRQSDPQRKDNGKG